MPASPSWPEPALAHGGASREHRRLIERGLSLDLTRGKPATDQLDLASRMLEAALRSLAICVRLAAETAPSGPGTDLHSGPERAGEW